MMKKTLLALFVLGGCFTLGAEEIRLKETQGENKKWGYKDLAGRWVVPAEFDFAYPFGEDLGAVVREQKTGFIDATGKTVIPFLFAQGGTFSEGWVGVRRKEGGFWVYIDKTGKQTLPGEYRTTGQFFQGAAMVYYVEPARYGLINKKGEPVTPPMYDEGSSSWGDGLCRMSYASKSGYLDSSGQVVIPPVFEGFCYDFKNGQAKVKLNGKELFIDPRGRPVDASRQAEVEAAYVAGWKNIREAIDFNENLDANLLAMKKANDRKIAEGDEILRRARQIEAEQAKAKVPPASAAPAPVSVAGGPGQDGPRPGPALYTKDGREKALLERARQGDAPAMRDLAELYFVGDFEQQAEGQYWVELAAAKGDKNAGFRLELRKKQGDVMWGRSWKLPSGYTIFRTPGLGSYGIRNPGGVVVTRPRYESVDRFYEGLASVCLKNQKKGYIDEQGREVIAPQFWTTLNFSEGLAGVQDLIQGWGYIDKEGKRVVPMSWQDAQSFAEGLAAVKKNGKWGFINREGKPVSAIKYDTVSSFSDGMAAVNIGAREEEDEEGYVNMVGGKWGFIDRSGREVIPLKYDAVEDFSYGTAKVALGENELSLNKKGEVVSGRP